MYPIFSLLLVNLITAKFIYEVLSENLSFSAPVSFGATS